MDIWYNTALFNSTVSAVAKTWHLPRKTEENHIKLSGQSVPEVRFKTGTPK
jgi:hypothetical protein